MSDNEPRPTYGPWDVEYVVDEDSGRRIPFIVSSSAAMVIAKCYRDENARLIAEAGTVYHETGLTPRELLHVIRISAKRTTSKF